MFKDNKTSFTLIKDHESWNYIKHVDILMFIIMDFISSLCLDYFLKK